MLYYSIEGLGLLVVSTPSMQEEFVSRISHVTGVGGFVAGARDIVFLLSLCVIVVIL